jgi:ABC-type transporter Mla MlaB component
VSAAAIVADPLQKGHQTFVGVDDRVHAADPLLNLRAADPRRAWEHKALKRLRPLRPLLPGSLAVACDAIFAGDDRSSSIAFQDFFKVYPMSLVAVAGPTGVAGLAGRVWVVEPGIDPAGVAAVCERFASFASCAGCDVVIVCDVGAITHPDVATLSLLTRLQLTARRSGRGIQLHRAQSRLIELIHLCGLGAVLPLYRASPLELGGQPKQGEEPVHIKEVVDPLDPSG